MSGKNTLIDLARSSCRDFDPTAKQLFYGFVTGKARPSTISRKEGFHAAFNIRLETSLGWVTSM